ncbi:hypothetical protein FOVSG1_015230 [Fusarium oxysporum f. sp. vasinfectum]
MAANTSQNILIVGAGPVGLFLGYRLGKAGIDVTIIEKEDGIIQQPRASAYYGGAALALKDAGLLHLAAQRGYVATSFGWRSQVKDDEKGGKTWGDLLAELPFRIANLENPEEGMTLLPQPKFGELVMEQAVATGHVKVQFGAELVAIDNSQDEMVTATVKDVHSGAEIKMVGAFLVGTDGGKSTTRKLLSIPMQGQTWPERIIATDVMVPPNPVFSTVDAHFFMHPLHFGVIVPLEKRIEGQPSLWRFTLAVDTADTRPDDEVLESENLRSLFEVAMPGPRPLKYEVKRRAMYRIHQRLAATMFRGRCALAGDAAHLNNPFGAMGLTTGILDSDALADALLMVLNKEQPISLLERYSDERRKVFQNFVDPTTTHNKLRIQRDPSTAYEDWLMKKMRNPSQKTMTDFMVPYLTVWRTDMKAVAQEP